MAFPFNALIARVPLFIVEPDGDSDFLQAGCYRECSHHKIFHENPATTVRWPSLADPARSRGGAA